MSKIIGIASQKGGVGKSTTCRNLASELTKYLVAKGAIDMRFGRDVEEQMDEGIDEEMEIEFI